jgi:hypothetical protein
MTESQTSDTDDGIAEQAREKAGDAQEKLQEGAQKARSSMADQLDQRTGQASDQVRASASALRSAGDQLREQGQDTPAKLADRAADQGERIADYLRDTDGTRLLHDAEDFGRKRPVIVIGAGLVVGFAFSRVLKASSEQRYRTGPSPATTSARPTPPSAVPTTPAPAVPIAGSCAAGVPDPVLVADPPETTATPVGAGAPPVPREA